VLVFGLMAALLAAFGTAQRLVRPVADIARGTRAVADGDYEQRLPLPAQDDELAFLVASFNAMTRRIAQARDQAARSQRAAEEQRAYLETVLGRLSSGVIAFDDRLRLATMNPAARHILKLPDYEEAGLGLAALEQSYPRLAHWGETVRRHIAAGTEWREEVTLLGADGRQVLMCRGSPLPGVSPETDQAGERTGHVVVFDDITTLIRAQRDAAWGEVARRLAHEIKNPLTPIQLSAERLRHKLLARLPEAEARVVDRATHTIGQQVEAMKAMVNDFANYARAPQMQERPFAVDALITEVLDLYHGARVKIIAELGAPDAKIRGDSKRLRQVIHNLLKNAIEALDGREDGRVQVSTHYAFSEETPPIEIGIEDNGGGIDPRLIDRLFEPYVTSKAKGTGLGLAIVKKIIEEHGGIITAENADHGARFTARLPVWRDTPTASSMPLRRIGET
jgi:nitrogen fixation/metabolism regulation signal transduction histidine kinase